MNATVNGRYFQVEQEVHSGAVWEPIDNGRSDTLAQARTDMTTLERDLGWRGLRIAEYEETDDLTARVAVIEYGQEAEEDDE